VSVLDALLTDYVTVDVLQDAALREGIKEYSQWPTIPQLYVRGEFIGGSDIVSALDVSGELRDKLGDLVTSVVPKVTVTPAARAELTGAIEGATECIRLDVSAGFEHDLAVGVPEPRDIVVELGDGLRVSVPPSAARRADGIVIDIVSTPEGPAFKITNPNEPARVKRVTAKELHDRMKGGEPWLLIDVRPDGERALASVEGFRPVDEALEKDLESGSSDRPIAVLCHHGFRSQSFAEELARRGHKNVHNVTGGIEAWSSDVDPTVPRYCVTSRVFRGGRR
jgi:monothiol glutaredoxin